MRTRASFNAFTGNAIVILAVKRILEPSLLLYLRELASTDRS